MSDNVPFCWEECGHMIREEVVSLKGIWEVNWEKGFLEYVILTLCMMFTDTLQKCRKKM